MLLPKRLCQVLASGFSTFQNAVFRHFRTRFFDEYISTLMQVTLTLAPFLSADFVNLRFGSKKTFRLAPLFRPELDPTVGKIIFRICHPSLAVCFPLKPAKFAPEILKCRGNKRSDPGFFAVKPRNLPYPARFPKTGKKSQRAPDTLTFQRNWENIVLKGK